MSKGSANLYLSIQSGSSERTLVSLTDRTRALDRETQLLAEVTEGLAKANKPLREEQAKLQAQLKAQLKASQKEVNALQKAYDEYGDGLTKADLDNAIESHAKLKEALSEVNVQLGESQKTYKAYLETVRKGGLSDPGSGSSSSSVSFDLEHSLRHNRIFRKGAGGAWTPHYWKASIKAAKAVLHTV